MENRVGDKTPSTADIQKQITTVEALTTALGKYCVPLLPEQRQSLTRGRLGIEEYLARMALVAQKFGFNVPGASPSSLLNDVRTVKDLAPLEQALEKALQLVRDTRSLARSEAVEAGLLYYALAQAASGRSPELEVEVRAMRAFMATGPRRPRAANPTPIPAPSPDSPTA